MIRGFIHAKLKGRKSTLIVAAHITDVTFFQPGVTIVGQLKDGLGLQIEADFEDVKKALIQLAEQDNPTEVVDLTK